MMHTIPQNPRQKTLGICEIVGSAICLGWIERIVTPKEHHRPATSGPAAGGDPDQERRNR